MNWSVDEAGKITTSFVLLDGEVIELHFSGGAVSDQGRTSEAVRLQTAHAPFPAAWRQQQAIEASRAAGVQYQHGVFWQAVSGITLDEAIARLLNAILLFAGSMIGARLWAADR